MTINTDMIETLTLTLTLTLTQLRMTINTDIIETISVELQLGKSTYSRMYLICCTSYFIVGQQ